MGVRRLTAGSLCGFCEPHGFLPCLRAAPLCLLAQSHRGAQSLLGLLVGCGLACSSQELLVSRCVVPAAAPAVLGCRQTLQHTVLM